MKLQSKDTTGINDVKLAAVSLITLVIWLLILTTLCLSLPSRANADTLYLGAWSRHITEGGYNETHKLVAINRGQWLAGTFVNSYSRRTHLIGYGFKWPVAQHLDFTLYAGAVYGYRRCYGDEVGGRARLCPAVVPELSYTRYRVQPSVLLFAEAVAVSVKFEF